MTKSINQFGSLHLIVDGCNGRVNVRIQEPGKESLTEQDSDDNNGKTRIVRKLAELEANRSCSAIRNLFARYGIKCISELDPCQYNEFISAAQSIIEEPC